MINEILENGAITYYKNISKNGCNSTDIFKIEYDDEVHYLVCTFKGSIIVRCMLIT